MKIVVIGAGAAGLLCAGGLAAEGHEVTLIEKNERVGKKLFITGKGRCNLTNACDVGTFLDNVVSNPRFLNSSIYGFTPSDCMQYFESLGVKLKVERGERVFPVSDKSNDIVKALEKYVLNNGVDLRLEESVTSVEIKEDAVSSVRTDKGLYYCDAAVIATGGVTYPATGSCGDGYKIARKLGHNVVAPVAALVPLITKGVDGLAGLSLKNVTASIEVNGKTVASQFGEMLFTHNGVSGPVILTLSSLTGRYCDKNGIYAKNSCICIDLKPALDRDTLDARIVREISAAPKAQIKTLLCTLMPKSLVSVVISQSGADGELKASVLSKKQRESLVGVIKCIRFPLVSKERFEAGIVTQGGVDVSEVNPKDMQSKKIKGLYFIGEVLDVDALTGGFNLQIAFSTAMSVVRSVV